MRICLINTPTAAEFSDPLEFSSTLIRSQSCWPQLGVLTLATVCERIGCQISVFDLNRAFFRIGDQHGEAGLAYFAEFAAAEIAAKAADVYGFGTICSAYPLTLRICRQLKLIQPECTIVLGGPQASVVAGRTLDTFPFVDLVLRGEAERTLPLLLEEIDGARRFDKIPGLVFRSAFGIQQNPDPPVLMDLDELPMPAYHLTGELRGAHTAVLEAGRGCPFACTFCSTNDFFRRKFRLRSPQRILADMRAIHTEYRITSFDLTHDMFTVDSRRVREFCSHLIEAGDGFSWLCSARTDSVNQELIELMAAAGCEGMFFGVETGSERMQKIIDKHLDIGRANTVIDMVERAGIRSTVSLIIGFPEEQWEDLRQTVDIMMHSARTPNSGPQLNLLAPLANTPLHLKHRDELTLDLLCSECSQQGRRQNPEDIDLVERFRDLFPNFYLIPTPHLDRNLLHELREFSRMATHRFRWLFAAADQAACGMLDLFVLWVDYRRAIMPLPVGPDLRHYYRRIEFQRDFISFLRQHPAGADARIKVLSEFYERLDEAAEPQDQPSGSAMLTQDTDWSLPDIPARTRRSRVLQLDGNLNAMIDAVRNCQKYDHDAQRRFYVVFQSDSRYDPGYEVSRHMARLLELCDGEHTVEGVMEALQHRMPVTPETARMLVYRAMFEKARSEGLIAIYRTASAALPSQSGGRSMLPYSEISAAASRQNHTSAHLA